MDELSLFSGAGGGLLGTQLLGWRPIGYVEIDDYCQRVIAARIQDGFLPEAPIFSDVREFIQSGAAAEYRGFADVVTAGFPCQPFSAAGKQRSDTDGRNLWPETIECLRLVQPPIALLENVPGLLWATGSDERRYFGRILGDLAESGYDARWRVLSAAELGAPHRRDRVFILVYTDQGRRKIEADKREGEAAVLFGANFTGGREGAGHVANSNMSGCGQLRITKSTETQRPTSQRSDCAIPNTNNGDQEPEREDGRVGRKRIAEDAQTSDAHASRGRHEPQAQPVCAGRNCTQHRGWWEAEPAVGRVVDGLAHRVDRLRAIGNGQVPAVVAAVWQLLTEDLPST